MKRHLGLLLIILGLLLLAASISTKFYLEQDFYRHYINEQQSSLSAGWQQQWQNYVIEQVRSGQIDDGYTLLWNRGGYYLTENFFPAKSAHSIDWNNYYSLSSTKAQQHFLLNILQQAASWDRAMAVKLWHQQFSSPPDVTLTPYEKTLVNAYTKQAYQILFEQFENPENLNDLSDKYQLDKAFIKINEQGLIVSFYPSRLALEKALETFSIQQQISGVNLNINPMQLTFDKNTLPLYRQTKFFIITTVIALVVLALGSIISIKNLQRKKQELEKRIGFLNQLLHEIKTPLAGIKLSSQTLEKYGFDESLLKSISQNINRIDQTMENIIAINQSSSLCELKIISAETFNHLLNKLAAEYPDKITLSTIITQHCKTEPKRLQQILSILIDNAIKYGERATITIKENNNTITVAIKDHGPGVLKEDKQKIFTPFYRATKATQLSPDGFGLGLAIAKKWAGEIGAGIQLANAGEVGACFEVSLKSHN